MQWKWFRMTRKTTKCNTCMFCIIMYHWFFKTYVLLILCVYLTHIKSNRYTYLEDAVQVVWWKVFAEDNDEHCSESWQSLLQELVTLLHWLRNGTTEYRLQWSYGHMSLTTMSFLLGVIMWGRGKTESVAAFMTSNCSASFSWGSSFLY